MKKAETIERYGEEAYKKQLEQSRAWNKAHKEEENAYSKKYREEHPEEVKANSQEQSRKGGRRYDKQLKYMQTGIQGARNRIRNKHNREFREIKDTLAQEVELHHEWIGDTAEYRGVALVEKKAHQQGIIDVILLLDGEITLVTEEEVKNGKKNRTTDL